MYELAHALGHPLSVILSMTVDEFNHWFTFLRLKHDKGKKNVRQQKPSSSGHKRG